MPNDGGPIYPQTNTGLLPPHGGLSLRDYFAAVALHASVTCPKPLKGLGDDADVILATLAYRVADAMIAARNDG